MGLILGVCGFHAFIDTIIPHEIVSGIVVVIGFSMASQVIAITPQRWYPAILVGLGICFPDYLVGAFQVGSLDIALLKNGYVWISLLYAWFLAILIDRWFLAASGVFVLLALATTTGLIHAPKLSLEYNDKGTIKSAADVGMELPGWKFILTYMLAAVITLGFHVSQKRGWTEPPEDEDFRVLQEEEISNSKPKEA